MYEQYLPGINVEEGLGRLNGNKKLYFMLLQRFNGEELLQELEAAVKENDFEKAVFKAHTLKGLAANLSMPQLQEISLKIETAAKANINPDEFLSLLKDELGKVLVAIEELIASEA